MATKPKPGTKLTATDLGRPRVYATDMPVYDSMAQCSSATGIPKSALSMAKDKGCLFVRHGRVHLGEFLRWWFSQPDDDGEDQDVDWKADLTKQRAMLAKVHRLQAEDKVVDFANVRKFYGNLISNHFFAELDRLAAEFPVTLKGKTEVDINLECQAQIKKVKRYLLDQLDVWELKKGKI